MLCGWVWHTCPCSRTSCLSQVVSVLLPCTGSRTKCIAMGKTLQNTIYSYDRWGPEGATPPHTQDSQTISFQRGKLILTFSHSHRHKKQAYVLHKSSLKIAGQPTSWQASLDCLIMKCSKHLWGCQSGFMYVATHSPLLDFQRCYHFGIYGWWSSVLSV